MKYFLEYNDKKYSNIDLIDTFLKLGIKKVIFYVYIPNFLILEYPYFQKMNFYKLYQIASLR